MQDELKKADVIIVLGGGNDRVEEAVRLYNEGLAGHMIMTGNRVAGGMQRSAVRLGVPEGNIILETEARSTYQHPGLVKPIMQARGFKSAIVVSSPYHMRRSAMLFDRAFKNSGIDLIYHPVQDSWFDADDWWTKAVSRREVKMEYVKLAVNVWGTRVSQFVGNLVGESK
ncbi:MAG: YdcF family protein [Candidatus Omnitrophica bacterium]|nr:YdcF family protein [Candidatus Omnitrophota bacterium]